MNLDLDDLLENKTYLEKLADYIHIGKDEYNTIPIYSYIMYIDRDGSVKAGGFLIRYYPGQKPDEKRFLLKINNAYTTLYPIFYHIFYKPNSAFRKKSGTKNKNTKIKTFLKHIDKLKN